MIYFRNRMRILNHLKYRSHMNRLNFMMAGPLVSLVRSHVLNYECKLSRGGVMLLLYVRTWLPCQFPDWVLSPPSALHS